jgi:hypothetical protein
MITLFLRRDCQDWLQAMNINTFFCAQSMQYQAKGWIIVNAQLLVSYLSCEKAGQQFVCGSERNLQLPAGLGQ